MPIEKRRRSHLRISVGLLGESGWNRRNSLDDQCRIRLHIWRRRRRSARRILGECSLEDEKERYSKTQLSIHMLPLERTLFYQIMKSLDSHRPWDQTPESRADVLLKTDMRCAAPAAS